MVVEIHARKKSYSSLADRPSGVCLVVGMNRDNRHPYCHSISLPSAPVVLLACDDYIISGLEMHSVSSWGPFGGTGHFETLEHGQHPTPPPSRRCTGYYGTIPAWAALGASTDNDLSGYGTPFALQCCSRSEWTPTWRPRRPLSPLRPWCPVCGSSSFVVWQSSSADLLRRSCEEVRRLSPVPTSPSFVSSRFPASA